MAMLLFFQQLIEGLMSGAIYASLALALVFSFRSTNVVNFAQGEMAMLSTFFAWQLVEWGLPVLAAMLASVVVSFVAGGLLYVIFVKPIARAPALTVVTVLIGLFIALNSLGGFVWGYLNRSFPSPFSGWKLQIGPLTLSGEFVGIVVVLLLTLLVLNLVFEHTRLGLAMRAAAAAPEQSRLVGIPVEWMLLAGWGVAAALGAIGGVLIAPRLFVSPGMMLGVIIYAFAAATLGGFDSVLGAVVGGLIVGVAENMAATFVPWIGADLKVVVALVVIFATLLVRPSGLFGRRSVVRV
jgi:branched-chain amino acid transport system permease protein